MLWMRDDTKVYSEILDLPYAIFAGRERLPAIAAVYFVVWPYHDHICYVGQTGDLLQRWANHHRAAQMSPAHRIYWAECGDEVERAQLEIDCIQGLQPPWNESRSDAVIRALTWQLNEAQGRIRLLEFDNATLTRQVLYAGDQLVNKRRVDAYIRDVAAYLEIKPDDLVCQILTEWAYNRNLGREG